MAQEDVGGEELDDDVAASQEHGGWGVGVEVCRRGGGEWVASFIEEVFINILHSRCVCVCMRIAAAASAAAAATAAAVECSSSSSCCCCTPLRYPHAHADDDVCSSSSSSSSSSMCALIIIKFSFFFEIFTLRPLAPKSLPQLTSQITGIKRF